MKILFFSSDEYIEEYFTRANKKFKFTLNYNSMRLNSETAFMAKGYPIISCSVSDELDALTLKTLSKLEVKLVALRSVGYNNVNIKAATKLPITIAYVPTYSPHSVAEHAVALVLTLNRKIHKAYLRVREGNFSLRNLIGFDLYGTRVGIVGTGRIGTAFAQIMRGFGCELLGYDKVVNKECLDLGLKYVPLKKLLAQTNIISLHCPLVPGTYHIIDAAAIKLMASEMMLINTSRGGLIDTAAVIRALKSGKIAYLGLDVYEAEKNLFYNDLSMRIINDDLFSRLQTFPNVLITSHQGFLTKQAYTEIANTTLQNVQAFITRQGKLYTVVSEKNFVTT